MRDFLLRLESEQAASEPKPEQIVEPEQIAEPQPTAKQAMLSPEDIHKKFSALKKPRRAFALFARDKRPALEERGMSLGEIGTALRPAFLRATTSRLHPPVGLTLGKMWSSLEQDDKEEYEGMEQYDKYRYDTELEFANFSRGGKSMLNFPLSWIYPCTGPRDFFDNCPATWRLDERGDGHRDDYYATVALPEVALTSGKWYYEVTILKVPEALQLGWARSGFSANPEGGCGDDEFSYSCDRVRCLLWHSEEDTPWNACLHGPASEKATDVGDVIGCMLDLDRGEIRFSIDGLVEEEPEFPKFPRERLLSAGDVGRRNRDQLRS
ncbi:hypothetical protein JL722_2769 [Aureococcus anophagefferens]|nr:hypothetical protein JL722_2769 [Aureococcus anophagefferens]